MRASVRVALACCFCTCNQVALAARPATATADTSQQRVEMSLNCTSAEGRAIQARLAPGLREFELQVNTTPLADHPEGALARIWIDCSTPTRIRLTISDGPRTQYYRRDFDLEHGLDSVALELLALVVQSSLESLAAGKPLGDGASERSDAPLPDAAAAPDGVAQPNAAPEPNTAAEPSTRVEPDDRAARTPALSTPGAPVPLMGYGHYDARMIGSQNVLHGPGLGAQLWFGKGATPVLVAVAGFAYWPMQVSDEGFGARLEVYEARSLLGARITNEGDFSAALVTGVGVWFMHVEPIELGNGVAGEMTQVAEPFWTRSVVSYLGARAEWRLAGLSVAVDLAAELELSRVRLSVQRDGRAEEVFTPWWARPRLGLGVGF